VIAKTGRPHARIYPTTPAARREVYNIEHQYCGHNDAEHKVTKAPRQGACDPPRGVGDRFNDDRERHQPR
jgi:hypothetical protein